MGMKDYGINTEGAEEESATTPPLTYAQSRNILFCVKRCEYPNCLHAAQEVHHITPREDGGKHTYQNMIGLCGYHHNEATANLITPKLLRDRIKKRHSNVEHCVKNVIKGMNKKNKKHGGSTSGIAPGYGIN
jgi:5-methylcytosine-specific restriction endonuclease McrA